MAETSNLNITLMEVGQSGKEATFNAAMEILDAATGALSASFTDHGVLVGSGTDPITALSVGATGTVLAGNTGADPEFTATPTVTSLTISGTSGTILACESTLLVVDADNNRIVMGTGSPSSARLHVDLTESPPAVAVGLRNTVSETLTGNNASGYYGVFSNVTTNQAGHNATASPSSRAFYGDIVISGASGTVTGATCFMGQVRNTGAGTLTNGYGFLISSTGNTGGGTFTNGYGIFIDQFFTAATNNYAFYSGIAASSGRWNLYMAGTANNYLAGSLGIGTGGNAPGALLDLGQAGTTKGVLRLAGNTSGNVTVQPAAAAGTWTLTLPSDDGNATDTLYTDGSGVTSWLPTTLVETFADATSVTPALGVTGRRYLGTQTNTQAGGTLTVNAPTGTPTDGQIVMLRLKLTNAQTMSFNAIYRGSTDLVLPASLGAGATHYLCFQYNATDTKYDYLAENKGF